MMPVDTEAFDARWQPEPMSGCWLWIGGTALGYGRIRVDGSFKMAHRLSYERFVGPIPESMHLDHLCRTPACINPEHLEPVTSRENTMRGIGPTAVNARKTHCIRGHEFNEANTYLTKKGQRYCRPCQKLAMRSRRAEEGLSRGRA